MVVPDDLIKASSEQIVTAVAWLVARRRSKANQDLPDNVRRLPISSKLLAITTSATHFFIADDHGLWNCLGNSHKFNHNTDFLNFSRTRNTPSATRTLSI